MSEKEIQDLRTAAEAAREWLYKGCPTYRDGGAYVQKLLDDLTNALDPRTYTMKASEKARLERRSAE